MDQEEIRAKRLAIRQEIKARMQRELDERKKEIRDRISRENLSVQEKRAKYRQKVHEEKLRLMELAKEEFKARKRMLGISPEEDVHEEIYEEPPPLPSPVNEEDQPAQEEAEWFESQPKLRHEEAFVYEDEGARDILREFESPIGEADVLPPDTWSAKAKAGIEPELVMEEVPETQNLIHYIVNLVFHPVQTLDEFDDYLASPSRIVKVVAFYFLSLLPLVAVAMVAEGIGKYLPGGLLGSAIGSAMAQQPDPLMIVGKTVINLLIYSLSISIVNYFVTDEANFITLTIYFGFVEGVTRLITYTLVILLIGAAIVAPPLLGIVGLLFLAFFFWTIALNIIVLMSAYGYDLLGAFFLSIGASVVRSIFFVVLARQFNISGF